jgi:small subunit ribosomal protein S1
VEAGQVFVELGPKVHGVLPAEEFDTPPVPGEEHEFSFVSINPDGLWTLSRTEERTRDVWRGLEPGKSVEARVIGENSGGLELKVGPVSAFLPQSQLALEAGESVQNLFGRTLECEVLEVNRKRRRVVLSRRAVVQRRQREKRQEALARLAEGDVRRGRVVRLESFGAIVDLEDGLSGLVHVSNIAHQRIREPSEVLEIGQEVDVKVLEIKKGGKRIGLGMKQLKEDPWSTVRRRFPAESRVSGTVTRLTEFGAFVKLDDGLEGLLHISQVSPERVQQVADAVQVGQEVAVRILSVDTDRRRISLSRLNRSGALLGSEEDDEQADVADASDLGSEPPPRGTNLGDVLRRALEGK